MGATVDETALIAALRRGDERVFADLVDQHSPSMLRVARGYVPNQQIAEEVVQETWIALFKGIATFEGRSSLRTWLFAVMINIAKARGLRERRDADAAVAAPSTPPDSARPGMSYPGIGNPSGHPHRSPTPPKGRCSVGN